MTLTEFILTRIAEESAVHPEHGFLLNVEHHASDCAVITWLSDYNPSCDCGGDVRWLAYCSALRRIVAQHEPDDEGFHICHDSLADDSDCVELRALAGIWSDHEDYRPEEWA